MHRLQQMCGFYRLTHTSTLVVIAIINLIPPLVSAIFATLVISKSEKLLDYSRVPSTFGTMFFCLITNAECICLQHKPIVLPANTNWASLSEPHHMI